ncbi:hypothetical protein RUND412_004815, partial [Rhizina undulata]
VPRYRPNLGWGVKIERDGGSSKLDSHEFLKNFAQGVKEKDDAVDYRVRIVRFGKFRQNNPKGRIKGARIIAGNY